MKTTLPTAIQDEHSKIWRHIHTEGDAKKFLKELFDNGESYHPDDDVFDLIDGLFNEDESKGLNKIMQEIYSLPSNFDPCQYLLDLDLEFHKHYNIEEYETETGYTIREPYTKEEAEQFGDYGQIDRLLIIERAKNEILFISLNNDIFNITYNGEIYTASSLKELGINILEGFVYCYGEDKLIQS